MFSSRAKNIILILVVVVFNLTKCSDAVIYYLNDTEYDLMPPLFELDQYDTCLRRGGTYCVAKFHLNADTDHTLMTMIREYSMYDQKHYNHTYIERGICVMKRCQKFLDNKDLNREEDLKQILEACQNETIWKEYGLQSKLSTIVNCDTSDKTIETDVGDKLLAAVVAALVVMNVIGSFYDVVFSRMTKGEKSNSTGNATLLCFSIFRNWKWLVTPTDCDSDMEKLKGFLGLKALSSFLVIIAHVLLLSYPFVDNPHTLEKTFLHLQEGTTEQFIGIIATGGYLLIATFDTWYWQIITNGLPIVQLFFGISGFLMIYNLEVRQMREKISWKLIPLITFYRWLRLTPVYALILAFTMTWLRHLGSGPLWYHVIHGPAAQCRQNWWLHLLYVHNYNTNDRFCVLPSWHLATDTQLFLLGLIMYVATARASANVRNWVLGLVVLIGMALPAIDIWRMDLNAIVLMNPETYRALENDTFFKIHNRGHNNITCFAIGMAVGYMVYARRNVQNNFLRHKITKLLVWLVLPVGAALFLSGRVFYEGPKAAVTVRMAYAASSRLALGILVGFSIFCMTLKMDVGLRHFLEWRGWLVPGRLSFCVYLLHMNIVHIMLGARTQLHHVTFFNLILDHLSVAFLSFLLALPLHLLVEAPVNCLLHHTFSQLVKKPAKKVD